MNICVNATKEEVHEERQSGDREDVHQGQARARLTNGARNLQFYSVLSRSRSCWTFCMTMKYSTRSVSWTTRIGPRGRLYGLSFVRRTIWIKIQSQCTLFGKVTHMKSGQGEPQLTERQKWSRNNFEFLRDHIVHHFTAKSKFRAPKGFASQASAAAGSSSRWETVQTEPFRDTSCQSQLVALRHLAPTHTPTTRQLAVSVMSSLADSDLQAALAESQRGITELKDIVVETFGDDKPDNTRLGFCDFLKVEVVQLTSDSYDEFQQETFNLLMRLKRGDKQQQRYHQGISTSMAQTVSYSQASTSYHYPVSHTQMQTPHQQMQ